MVVFTTISCLVLDRFLFCDFGHFSMASRLSPLAPRSCRYSFSICLRLGHVVIGDLAPLSLDFPSKLLELCLSD